MIRLLSILSLGIWLTLTPAQAEKALLSMNTPRTCHGHFTLVLPDPVGPAQTQSRANFNLSDISAQAAPDRAAFDLAVAARRKTLTGTGGAPDEHKLPDGVVLVARDKPQGGTLHGLTWKGTTAFETQTIFSDRMFDAFLEVAKDTSLKLRDTSIPPLPDTVFCFEGGQIIAPVTTPSRAQVYDAVYENADGNKLQITSEWLAAPELSFSAPADAFDAARKVASTTGIELRQGPDAPLRDGPFVLMPEGQQTFYYQGLSKGAPGLRLTLRLWSPDPEEHPLATEEWEALLASVQTLAGLGAR